MVNPLDGWLAFIATLPNEPARNYSAVAFFLFNIIWSIARTTKNQSTHEDVDGTEGKLCILV